MTIFTENRTVTLKAFNEVDLKKWARALEHVAFKYKQPQHRNTMLEEENDLYCPTYADGDGIFTVILHETDAIQLNCSLKPKTYSMHLTSTEIQLKNVNSVEVVAEWPYQFIRNYKCINDKIKFEAGRKCDTGEGEFVFQHSNPKIIFRCLRRKMKAMKKSMNSKALAAATNSDDDEFNPAMSMKAGSRCPLIFGDGGPSQNSHLIFGLLSSSKSLKSIHLDPSNITGSMQIIPLKPTRKSQLTDANEKPSNVLKVQQAAKTHDYEPIELEQTNINDLSKKVRRKAVPQTLTLVKCRIQNRYDYEHIQSPSAPPEFNDIENLENKNPEKFHRSRMILMDNSIEYYEEDEEDYDKLDFFAPNQLTPSTDYPKVICENSLESPIKKLHFSPPRMISDDYEIIGENTMNELKAWHNMKPSPKLSIDCDDLLNHSRVNGLEYAIISKPKQV